MANPLTLSVSHTDSTDPIHFNGTATATAGGGSGGYSYTWSDGQTGPYALNLGGGSYWCSVYDGKDTVQVMFTVNQYNVGVNDEIPSFNIIWLNEQIAKFECCMGELGYQIVQKIRNGTSNCACDKTKLSLGTRLIDVLKTYNPPGTIIDGVAVVDSDNCLTSQQAQNIINTLSELCECCNN